MMAMNDREKCAHLLRRFGLGASEAELDYYLQGGTIDSAIERLLDYENVTEPVDIKVDLFASPKDGRLKVGGLIGWWTTKLMTTSRPLQEKMVLFWHNHFATSAEKITRPEMMAEQNEVFRRNATGNFRTLLKEVSKDPAMVIWLDNQLNVKGHANENFAREVMELFTLGIGNYTEKDVQEGARAFTGWSYRPYRPNIQTKFLRNGTFINLPEKHDDGVKTFLGNSGPFDGDDILNILCDQPRTAQFITEKLWKWFISDQPDEAEVTRLAGIFRNSGLELKPLLRAIMQSPFFYSDKVVRKLFKNPIDVCIATQRQLGVGARITSVLKAIGDQTPKGIFGPAGASARAMKSMGLAIFFPPDVSGWKPGPGWITSATMVERIGWGEKIYKSAGPRANILAVFGDSLPPATVVNRVLSLYDVKVPDSHRAILENAAQKAYDAGDGSGSLASAVTAVTKLLFATPEFQFC